MFKMSLWLVAAIALGFIFGWLLSKVLYENKYREEVDTLDGDLFVNIVSDDDTENPLDAAVINYFTIDVDASLYSGGGRIKIKRSARTRKTIARTPNKGIIE